MLTCLPSLIKISGMGFRFPYSYYTSVEDVVSVACATFSTGFDLLLSCAFAFILSMVFNDHEYMFLAVGTITSVENSSHSYKWICQRTFASSMYSPRLMWVSSGLSVGGL